MLVFLDNWALVLAMLIGLGIAGGFTVMPFRRQLPFAILVAPLAGLMVVTLGALAMYVALKLPMRTAGIVAWGTCAVVTGMTWLAEGKPLALRFPYFLGVLATVTAAVATAITTTTSIQLGDWGFLYFDGTDQLGYAHMADWFNTHLITELPVADPAYPYQSYINWLTVYEPRFGSYGALALVSQVTRHSGMFTFDVACALVLTLTTLGVAAVFSRARSMLVLVVSGLVTCHWYDYGRCGFFSKTLSFPTSFLAAGLFIAFARCKWTLRTASMLVLLTACAAIMQSGLMTALFMFALCAPLLVAIAVYALREGSQDGAKLSLAYLRESALVLALALGVSVIATGTIARPVNQIVPYPMGDWNYIYSRIADLEHLHYSVSGLTDAQLQVAVWVAAVIWLVLASLAVLNRRATATALCVGPMLLLVGLRAADAAAMTNQMLGVFYPLALCGAASLVGADSIRLRAFKSRRAAVASIAFGLAFVGVLLHLPRCLGSIKRYCRHVDSSRLYSLRQMDGLKRAIGNETVDVATWDNVQYAIAVLVELGRTSIALQWTPEVWNVLLDHRVPHWPPPSYSQPGAFRLTSRATPLETGDQVAYQTNQFRLIRPMPLQ